MSTASVSIDIAAPIETVWRLVGDAALHPTFDTTTARIVGHGLEEGARLWLVTTLDPDRPLRFRVVVLAPPRRMVWRKRWPFGLLTVERSFAIDPLAGTHSRFTLRETRTGPLLRLARRRRPDAEPALASFAAGLKELAESTAKWPATRRGR